MDTNFIFSCWKYPSLVRFAHSWEILSAPEHKIRIPARPCNTLYTYTLRNIHQAVSWSFIDKWVLANQKSEQPDSRTVFFRVWEKLYVQSEVSEVCELRAKIPSFYRRLQLAARSYFADIQRESFSRKVFLVRKWKTSRKSKWISFVFHCRWRKL